MSQEGNGVYIGYWYDDQMNKVYSVGYATSYAGAGEDLNYYRSMGLESTEYLRFIDDIWVSGSQSKYFHKFTDAYEYARELNKQWGFTEFGVREVGCFDTPLPKEVKLSIFR